MLTTRNLGVVPAGGEFALTDMDTGEVVYRFRTREDAEQQLTAWTENDYVDPAEFTAVRTWNRTGSKATITLHRNGEPCVRDGKPVTASGTRAARAQAWLCAVWPRVGFQRGIVGCYGLRSSYAKAVTEADGLARLNRVTGRRYTLPVMPAAQAFAIPVTDA